MSFYPYLGGGAPVVYGATAIISAPAFDGMLLLFNPNRQTAVLESPPLNRQYNYAWMYFVSADGNKQAGERVQSGDYVRVVYSLCGTTSLSAVQALTAAGWNQPLVFSDLDTNDNNQVFRVTTTAGISRYLAYSQDFTLSAYATNAQVTLPDIAGQPLYLSGGGAAYGTLRLLGPDMRVPVKTPPVNSGCGYRGTGSVSPILWGVLIMLVFLFVFMLW